MHYTVKELAQLAGISTRTLRYYDEIGLLSPARMKSNGYRVYGQKEVDRLQQILFYRELGLSLEEIGKAISSKDFDEVMALQDHLGALRAKREQLDTLIANVEQSLLAAEGGTNMSNDDKFKGFTKKLVEENEQKYGKEIREKYGDEAVEGANAKVMGMTEEQYAELENLTAELNETLKAAVELGDPASGLAQKACELHKRWLCYFWSSYSKEAHIGVTNMYVEDPRFNKHYEEIALGCAPFLRDAVAIYCQ